MAIIVPNSAENTLLRLILETSFGDGFNADDAKEMTIRLFDEDLTLGKNTTLAELEAGELSSELYPANSGDSGGSRVIDFDDWSLTTDDTPIAELASNKSIELEGLDSDEYKIYGYFITKTFTDGATSVEKLMWCEKFSTSFTIPAVGATLNLKLRLELN